MTKTYSSCPPWGTRLGVCWGIPLSAILSILLCACGGGGGSGSNGSSDGGSGGGIVLQPGSIQITSAAQVATQGQTINTTPRMTGLLGSALSPGDQIKVYDGATELGVATVTGTTWTYTPATALALGAHTFKAKWIPVNGTTVTVSNDFVLTIQTSKLPHTGVSASQCYQSSADALLSC
ncbi:MAG: hypothetical protein RIT26_763, partial [Pseudomonadota bacterium]